MSRTLIEQEAIDRQAIFSVNGGWAEDVLITTGSNSQTVKGIFYKPQSNSEKIGDYNGERRGDFFVTFNANDVTVDIDEDNTIIVIRDESYSVRRQDPPHADIKTVYLK